MKASKAGCGGPGVAPGKVGKLAAGERPWAKPRVDVAQNVRIAAGVEAPAVSADGQGAAFSACDVWVTGDPAILVNAVVTVWGVTESAKVPLASAVVGDTSKLSLAGNRMTALAVEVRGHPVDSFEVRIASTGATSVNVFIRSWFDAGADEEGSAGADAVVWSPPPGGGGGGFPDWGHLGSFVPYADITAVTGVVLTPCRVRSMTVTNRTALAAFFVIYDVAAAPAAGDLPSFLFPLAAGQTLPLGRDEIFGGIRIERIAFVGLATGFAPYVAAAAPGASGHFIVRR